MAHVSIVELLGALLVGVSAVAAIDAKPGRGRTLALVCAVLGLLLAWVGRR